MWSGDVIVEMLAEEEENREKPGTLTARAGKHQSRLIISCEGISYFDWASVDDVVYQECATGKYSLHGSSSVLT